MTGVGAPNARQVKFTVRLSAAFTTDGDASVIDGASAGQATQRHPITGSENSVFPFSHENTAGMGINVMCFGNGNGNGRE